MATYDYLNKNGLQRFWSGVKAKIAEKAKVTLTGVDPGEGSALAGGEYIAVYGNPDKVDTADIEDGAVTASKIDWASVGAGTAGGFLRVVTKTASKAITVGDNIFSESISSVIPSGYRAIGIVGTDVAGEGYTQGRITKNILSGDSVSMSFYTTYGNSTITFTWYILVCRNA